MSFNKGHRKYHGKHNYSAKPKMGDKAREVLETLDASNPVLMMFKEYATALDEKHDRYERVVKINRDITIESKRIIFLLHNSDADMYNKFYHSITKYPNYVFNNLFSCFRDTKRDAVLKEAEDRLILIIATLFKTIAIELHGHDHYHYQKAYSGGLQEFIEAFVLHQYLCKDSIDSWDLVRNNFLWKLANAAITEDGETKESDINVELLISPVDFILGIADFTGELMRKCINYLGNGKIDECFKICTYVKFIYSGFLGINNSGYKEIGRKLYVLRQSLTKMELVCYNLRVRGSEIPKHMLVIVATSTPHEVNNEEDEGYF